MAITRRNWTHKVDNRGVNNIELDVPAGTTTGDVMFAFVATIAFAPTTMQALAGWTKIGEHNNAGTDNTTSWIFKRNATGSEPASYTWTWGNNGKSLGGIITYTGVDPAVTPVPVVSGWVDPGIAVSGPIVNVPAGSWLTTWVFGRQSPKTDAVKSWSTSTGSDLELADEYTVDADTSRHATHALYDSNGPAPGGNQSRILTASIQLQQVHLWELVVPMLGTEPEPDPGGGGGAITGAGILPIR